MRRLAPLLSLALVVPVLACGDGGDDGQATIEVLPTAGTGGATGKAGAGGTGAKAGASGTAGQAGASGKAGAAGAAGKAGAAGSAGKAGAGGAAGKAGAAGVGGGAAGTGTSGTAGTGTSGAGGSTPVEPPLSETCPNVRVHVAAGATLNIRPTPSTAMPPVGTLPDGAVVPTLSKVHGQAIGGNDIWYEIQGSGFKGFVFSQYAECTFDKPPVVNPPSGFYLPLECGKTCTISQGNNGGFSHQGNAYYAFDFSIGVGTPLVAMADGVVIALYDQTGPGDPCYDGGPSTCYPYANYVQLRHGDGTASIYKHLSKVEVTLGQVVPRGHHVGLSGSTGYSTGPHAHVMRQEDCGQSTSCKSVAVSFVDVPGDGVPDTGQSVTSGNCF